MQQLNYFFNIYLPENVSEIYQNLMKNDFMMFSLKSNISMSVPHNA